MAESLAGCPEFDERLIEQAFAPSPDAELDRHLVRCARCRAARERYLATGDALGAALAVVPEPAAGAITRTSARRPRLLAAVAAAAVVIALFLLRSRPEVRYAVETADRRRPLSPASPLAFAPDRIHVESGTAEYTVDRNPLVVDTPLGVARCAGGTFTLSVAREGGREGGIDPMSGKQTGLVVTITVAAGAVWWAAGGSEVAVDPGSPWVEREAAPAETAAADLAGLESPDGAHLSERRAPLLRSPESGGSVAAAQPAPAGPDPEFKILGCVVDAETGEALAGATVTLGARRADRRAFEANATSDGAGRFRASSVALPGATPIRPGVAVDAQFVGTFLAARAEGYSPRFEVPWERFDAGSALDAREPIDLGEIRLHRGAAIAGSVVDEDGAPVADAALLLSQDRPGGAAFTPATAEEVGRSRADGSFSLARRVAPPDPHSRTHLFAVAPRGLGWATLDVLESKREMGRVEIRIGAPARLDVLVQDGGGRPIEGADVRLEPRFDPLITARRGRRHDHALFFGVRPDLASLFTAKSDVRGRARFERLPCDASGGSYDVVATAAGFARGWRDDVLVLASRDTSTAVALERYRTRSISGTVRSEDGAPLGEVKVETQSNGAMVAATTGAAGTYRLEGLDPSVEDGWFVLSLPGFVEIRRSVPLPVRGDLEGIDFVLERPRPIAGRIVDQDGRPVAGARPHLHREREYRAYKTGQGRTGEDGAFRFDDATAGTWTLQVQPPDPAAQWLSPYTNVEVEGGDGSIEVVLERARDEGTRVVVEIADAASGEALDPCGGRAVARRSLARGRAPRAADGRARGRARGGRGGRRRQVADVGARRGARDRVRRPDDRAGAARGSRPRRDRADGRARRPRALRRADPVPSRLRRGPGRRVGSPERARVVRRERERRLRRAAAGAGRLLPPRPRDPGDVDGHAPVRRRARPRPGRRAFRGRRARGAPADPRRRSRAPRERCRAARRDARRGPRRGGLDRRRLVRAVRGGRGGRGLRARSDALAGRRALAPRVPGPRRAAVEAERGDRAPAERLAARGARRDGADRGADRAAGLSGRGRRRLDAPSARG
jgi:hypothetical protein